jgi:hypothetical protein
MYNTDTEVIFPIRVIPSLRLLRGNLWQGLIDNLTEDKSEEKQVLAFILLMVRLGGCVNCNTDSYRAMRGCTQCAKQTIKRYRGSDQEIIELFIKNQEEIEIYLLQQKV